MNIMLAREIVEAMDHLRAAAMNVAGMEGFLYQEQLAERQAIHKEIYELRQRVERLGDGPVPTKDAADRVRAILDRETIHPGLGTALLAQEIVDAIRGDDHVTP